MYWSRVVRISEAPASEGHKLFSNVREAVRFKTHSPSAERGALEGWGQRPCSSRFFRTTRVSGFKWKDWAAFGR